jgi:hypothetical protein
MKKLIGIFSTVFFLIFSQASHAQTNTGADYFSGKWNLLVKGTPGGDRKLVLTLEKMDSTMTGVIQDTAGSITKIIKAELKATELTIFFNGEGYDLTLLLVKKDEDHVSGSLLNRFETEGERIKEKASK